MISILVTHNGINKGTAFTKDNHWHAYFYEFCMNGKRLEVSLEPSLDVMALIHEVVEKFDESIQQWTNSHLGVSV